MQARSPAGRTFVSALLLLGLVLVGAGGFVHTDDGCAVEQHCRACRVAVAGVAAHVETATVAPAPAQTGEPCASAPLRVPASKVLSSDSNRGPPSAA